MKKRIKLTAFLLAVFLAFTFAGCIENEDFVVYGRFQDNYTTDLFDVFCDWETINPLLDKCSFEEYGFYAELGYTFDETEEYINAIGLVNYNSRSSNNDRTKLSSVEISYGARCCNSVESQHHTGEKYFTEPMIQIQLYNPNAKRREHELEPDYILGYRAVYSLNGELALEEGEWFLEEDKDEFCRHYFEIMLKVIGKGT